MHVVICKRKDALRDTRLLGTYSPEDWFFKLSDIVYGIFRISI